MTEQKKNHIYLAFAVKVLGFCRYKAGNIRPYDYEDIAQTIMMNLLIKAEAYAADVAAMTDAQRQAYAEDYPNRQALAEMWGVADIETPNNLFENGPKAYVFEMCKNEIATFHRRRKRDNALLAETQAQTKARYGSDALARTPGDHVEHIAAKETIRKLEQGRVGAVQDLRVVYDAKVERMFTKEWTEKYKVGSGEVHNAQLRLRKDYGQFD